jgi:hypothetical protein
MMHIPLIMMGLLGILGSCWAVIQMIIEWFQILCSCGGLCMRMSGQQICTFFYECLEIIF